MQAVFKNTIYKKSEISEKLGHMRVSKALAACLDDIKKQTFKHALKSFLKSKKYECNFSTKKQVKLLMKLCKHYERDFSYHFLGSTCGIAGEELEKAWELFVKKDKLVCPLKLMLMLSHGLATPERTHAAFALRSLVKI